MAIKFSGCNCCCIYFTDAFDRPALAADGVNRDGSDRYEFTSGDWEVNVASGRLLCNTADSPIHFYDSPNLKSFQISADFRFHNIGDYVSILYDTDDKEAKIEWTDTAYKTLTIGTSTNTIAHTASSGKILMSLFTMSGFPSHTGLAYPYNSITGSKVAIGIDAFQWGSDCFTSNVPATGYTKYGFKASAGVIIDDLLVTYSKQECVNYINMGCGAVCSPDPLPSSVTISFSDIPNGYSRCRNDPAPPADDWEDLDIIAESTFESSRLACDSTWTSGTSDWCNCIQVATQTYWAATCDNYSTQTSCVVSCPGAMMNNVFILDKVTAAEEMPCTHCRYELEVTIPDYWVDAEDYVDSFEYDGKVCSTLVTGQTTIFSANMSITYYDSDTGDITVRLKFDTPLTVGKPEVSLSGSVFCSEDWSETQSSILDPSQQSLYGFDTDIVCDFGAINHTSPVCYDVSKQVNNHPDCGAYNNSHVDNPTCSEDSVTTPSLSIGGTI